MKRALAFCLAASIALTARAQEVHEVTDTDEAELAFADVSDPNPGSGRGQILAGWIATGVGVAGVVQAPLCERDDFDLGRRVRRCRNLGIVFGALGLSLGIPWLVFGYQRRSAQRAWKQRHGLTQLPDVQLGFDELLLTFRF
ncbi:MAG: hypothetical protein ABW352_19995 [Polyangiales bacterium]